MMQCPPPMPGNGINITVSIDLGSMLGSPCKPEMPPCPEDDDKLTYFNEANRPKPKSLMGGAIDDVQGKFGKPDKKDGPFDGKSSSDREVQDNKNKDEDEDDNWN